MEERQWIREIRKGNKQYLSDIVQKYYDDIYRFCAFQTGNREDAYDLVQETFLRFIRYAESYQSGNLKGYLLTIAMNLCRNYYRKQCGEAAVRVYPAGDGKGPEELSENQGLERIGGQTAEERMTPEELALERETGELLRRALNELPDAQREAVLLRYLFEMKYREISRLTGANLSTVKSRIRQGIDRLKKKLRREDFFDA